MLRISPTGSANSRRRGFMLMEIILALTIMAMLVGVAWPMLAPGTNATRLNASVIDVLTLLRHDRSRALATGRDTVTMIDLRQRTVASNSTRTIQLPADVTIDILSNEACTLSASRFAVLFRPDGTSCGGVLRIAKDRRGYEIQINWLTGAVRARRL